MMKILNLQGVLAAIAESSRAVTDAARAAVREGAEVIKEQAIKNAPVDTGELESSIDLEVARVVRPGVYRVNVSVSDTASAYAWIVHEYPWSKRGPKTRAKGPQAGPRYMARAFERHTKTVQELVREYVQQAIARRSRRAR